MSAKNKPTKEKLLEYAEAVRKELNVSKQNDVFKIAVEVGYLAAAADGKVEDAEKSAIIAAVDLLSKGLVIEWEVESIVEECAADPAKPTEKAPALGARLKELGQPEAGLLFGAFVAQSTAGIDRAEAKVLRAVGKAAGIADRKVREILKTVGAETPEGEAAD